MLMCERLARDLRGANAASAISHIVFLRPLHLCPKFLMRPTISRTLPPTMCTYSFVYVWCIILHTCIFDRCNNVAPRDGVRIARRDIEGGSKKEKWQDMWMKSNVLEYPNPGWPLRCGWSCWRISVRGKLAPSALVTSAFSIAPDEYRNTRSGQIERNPHDIACMHCTSKPRG